MTDKDRITHDDSEFTLTCDAGGTVGVYRTEQEAQEEIEAFEQDNLMLKTARRLVKKAVDALMRTYRIDGRTA